VRSSRGACNQEARGQMIKINLLPTKKKPPKKVMDLQKQLLLGGLVIILVLIVLWFFWSMQKARIDSLKQTKLAAENKIRQQDITLKDVKNVKEKRKIVEDKIKIVEDLEKNQAGPVRLLDEISSALPVGVNLLSLTENNKKVNIEGQAFTNEDVVRFIDNLKASRFFEDVVLLETSQAKQQDTEIYKYKLQFTYRGL
jgi:type IV pilus assembly protein PilN